MNEQSKVDMLLELMGDLMAKIGSLERENQELSNTVDRQYTNIEHMSDNISTLEEELAEAKKPEA